MSLKKSMLLTGMLIAASAGLAQAEMSATTVTDLQVRTGPGQQYPIVGIATRGSQAIIDGCIRNSRWCRVQLDQSGIRGWAYAQYLSVDQNGSPVVVEEHGAALGIPIVTDEEMDQNTTGAVVLPPVQPSPDDELIGRVGKVETIVPPETVRTYIDENPGDTVRLNGDVVVGAGLPDTVTVRAIPDYRYSYARVNDQPVLVDPGSRRIVYVYR
ncbi:DUF1236 domain-containing protein [Rhizobium sp. RAF56]|jgi:uncharacterized protein YraI|uniref:DUF1236 domain-containing protein n=1 Tax=Rhizobium sp. RAF56 TaxID=3233062 RepID=UPI003F94E0AB